MLSDLITFFTGSPQNRRKYPRRSGPFKAWTAQGTNWTSVVCIDISGSGLGLVSPIAVGTEGNFRVMLEERPVLLRAKRIWETPGTLQGKPAWRYGFTFTGISADDWDAVVRFCNNDAVVIENKAQKDLELVRLQADDVARLIPKRLQDQLLKMLVDRRRLAPLDDKHPLVQYLYGGVVKRANLALHRLVIHSRVRDPVTGETADFDTRFVFDDQGSNVAIDE
ncbi:MAG TPA: PilZ domain-containing protein [Candidatus Baltobacteraceae bacterium]|nr:PilZ domain-containing protein [Candidatus Baltobacteraceae bacterium]